MPPTTPSTETAAQVFNFPVQAHKTDRPDMRRDISAGLLEDLKKLDVIPKFEASKQSHGVSKVEKKKAPGSA